MATEQASQIRRVYSKDIFHGLPDLSNAPDCLTAVVTGANGISGAHMVRRTQKLVCLKKLLTSNSEIRVLASNPKRWKTIYALSKRPPSGSWPDNVKHISLDLLQTPQDIASVLKEAKIKADYVFWFAYVLVTGENGALEWGDDRLVGQNSMNWLL